MKKLFFVAVISLVFCAASHQNDEVNGNTESDVMDDVNEKSVSANPLGNVMPYWTLGPLNNSQCKVHMDFVLREANNLNLWALKMLDASAKLPSGILSGNLNQYGDFDECLVSQGILGTQVIKGKYCLATIDIQPTSPTSENPTVKALDDLMHSHRLFTNDLFDNGHRIPKIETFNWGICMPSSCTTSELETVVKDYFKKILHKNIFRFDVNIMDEVCYVKENNKFSITKLLVMSTFFLLILLTTLEFFIDVSQLFKGHTKTTKVLQCFYIKKNWEYLMKTDSSGDEINCLHGGRFLNAIALLFCHKQMAKLYNPIINKTSMTEAFSMPWSMIGRSAILYTDSFIFISGLLASYSLVRDLDKNKKIINLKTKIMSRLFRYTPSLMGIILFCTYVIGDMNSGPQWGLVINKYSNLCKKNMWRNFLYIHNYFGFENMCLTHTHQVGIDMQLFLVSPVLIYILWKFPKMGSIVLIGLSSLSTWLRYDVTRRQSLSTLIYYGISIEKLWKTANLSYILPTHRLTVYISGLMLGYYLRRNGNNLRFSQLQATAGWIAAVTSGLVAMFGFYKASYKGYIYDPNVSATFNAFAPILWTAFLIWSVIACQNGYGGFFNDFLSWKYFRIFTKISYAVYLTQFPVFFYNIGKQRSTEFFTGIHSLFDILEISTILIASIILTLMCDIPFQELGKALTKSQSKMEDDNREQLKLDKCEDHFKSHKIRRKLQTWGT